MIKYDIVSKKLSRKLQKRQIQMKIGVIELKKVISILLSLVMIISVFAIGFTTTNAADFNNDGRVTVTDCTSIQLFLAGW